MDLFSYLLGKKAGSGGGGTTGLDWTLVGYETEPESIKEAYDYAKEIYDNWEPSEDLRSKFLNDTNLIYAPLVDTSIATSTQSMFFGCTNLIEVPLINTGNSTTMKTMFNGCSNLTTIPSFDASKVTNFESMFLNCPKLSDESLNNILEMCIGAIAFSGSKTLTSLSISNSYYSAERIQALSNYQDFIDAGWTIGY